MTLLLTRWTIWQRWDSIGLGIERADECLKEFGRRCYLLRAMYWLWLVKKV
ncbi:MAG: hypothetical protein H6R14_783 [Proteobacteria bacterium]|nr:hypothetical protein [Pseudomonadota bacterium]